MFFAPAAFLAAALAVGGAHAQSSSGFVSASGSASAPAASSSTSAASLVPSTVSAACQSFLTLLDQDSTLALCVTPLLTLTNQAATSTDKAALTSSLGKLCAVRGCSDASIRSKLTSFYSACQDELSSDSSTIRELYDILYVVQPLRAVVCTQDEKTDEYCVTAVSANVGNATTDVGKISLGGNSTTAASNGTTAVTGGSFAAVASVKTFTAPLTHLVDLVVPSSLRKRASTTQQVVFPNATTYRNENLPYLFIQPDSPNSILCSSCAKAILTAYAAWEASTVYALGLAQSPILGGQADLWKGAAATCGSTWTQNIQQAAGAALATTSGSGDSSITGLSAGFTQVHASGSLLVLTLAGAAAYLLV